MFLGHYFIVPVINHEHAQTKCYILWISNNKLKQKWIILITFFWIYNSRSCRGLNLNHQILKQMTYKRAVMPPFFKIFFFKSSRSCLFPSNKFCFISLTSGGVKMLLFAPKHCLFWLVGCWCNEVRCCTKVRTKSHLASFGLSVLVLKTSAKLQGTLFFCWSIQYWRLCYIYRCYIVLVSVEFSPLV